MFGWLGGGVCERGKNEGLATVFATEVVNRRARFLRLGIRVPSPMRPCSVIGTIRGCDLVRLRRRGEGGLGRDVCRLQGDSEHWHYANAGRLGDNESSWLGSPVAVSHI